MTLTEQDIDAMHHETELDDIRDDVYTSDEIEWGGAQQRPRRVLHNETPILDQGRTDGCGTFSISKGGNELNYITQAFDWIKNNDEVLKNWELCCEKYGGKQPGGSTMQQNLNMMMDLGIIGGYYKAKDEEEQRIAIANGACIYIGSKFFDFKKFLYSLWAVFSDSATFGHLVIRNGYDDDMDGFIHANSWGTVVNDKGLFMTKYGQSKMYTPIVLVPKERADVINQVTLDRQLMKKAAQDKIWSEEKPDQSIFKEDFYTVLERLGVDTSSFAIPQGGEKISRGYIASKVAAVFGVSEDVIWKGQRPMDYATRYEAVLMAMRGACNVTGHQYSINA